MFRTPSATAALLALALATAPATAQDLTLRFGHDQPVGSMYDEGHQALKTILADKSGGKIGIDIFPAAQLGSEVAMVEGLRLGTLDGAVVHVANASTVVPELAIFSVAYLFEDADHYEAVINDPKFQERISSLVADKGLGLKVIGFYSAGVRNIYTRKGPANTPDELKGTKIRVMNNPVEAKIWSALGAIPTPMNFGEVYQSLQSGVLDAAENGLSVIETNRHFEAAKTIIMTEHQRSVAILFMSEAKFDALTPDQQKTMLDAAREASVIQRRRDTELNAEAVDRMKAKGAVFVEPDRAEFAARIAPIQDEVAGTLKMTDVLELIRAKAN
jgi:tripartite ATP-independent transporter DctP family solute receptor